MPRPAAGPIRQHADDRTGRAATGGDAGSGQPDSGGASRPATVTVTLGLGPADGCGNQAAAVTFTAKSESVTVGMPGPLSPQAWLSIISIMGSM